MVREASESTRIDLIEAVENTVTHLAKLQTHYHRLSSFVDLAIDSVRKAEIALDPEDIASDHLTTAIDSLDGLLRDMNARRRNALGDPQLRNDHEDSVVTEYDRSIDAACNLLERLTELRLVILEQDAEHAEYGESFENADGLIASLDAD